MRRVLYFDCLRTLAAFGVVQLHVAAAGWSFFPVGTIDWQLLNVVNGLTRWCVPLFVMISGALFLDLDRRLTIGDVYLKYVRKIVVIIAVWTLAVFGHKLVSFSCHAGFSLKTVSVAFQSTEYPPGVSWFLFMLLGLYALTPVLRCVSHDKKILLYVMSVSFVLNTATVFADIVPHGSWVPKQITLLGLDGFLGYIGYYCAGAFLHQVDLSVLCRRVLYAAGLGGVALTVLGTGGVSLGLQRPVYCFYSFLSPNVALMAAALFYFAKERNLSSLSHKGQQALAKISMATLLIYFLHTYVILGLKLAGLSVTTVPVGLAPLIAFLVFTVSLGMSLMLLSSRWVRIVFA